MYPHFKDMINNSIKNNEEMNLASHSKVNHAGAKPEVLNQASVRKKSSVREERSQSISAKYPKEKDSDSKGRVTPPISNSRGSRSSRIITWLDFTKSCRKRNPDS